MSKCWMIVIALLASRLVSAGEFDAVDELVEQHQSEWRSPGISIAIERAGEHAYARGRSRLRCAGETCSLHLPTSE